jgi:hypothetical protein
MSALLALLGATIALFVLQPVHACGASTNGASDTQLDEVAFFKRAITSPADIEHFVACEEILRPRGGSRQASNEKSPSSEGPNPRFFEGARAGSNYFLRHNFNFETNQLSGKSVVGRVGSNAYQVNPNTLTLTTETAETKPDNPVAMMSAATGSFVNQFLNMGLGDIKAATVRWRGDEFTAVRNNGSPVYGLLELSNGLPARLKICSEKGATPYKAIAYVYPEPPASLRGFPKRTIISSLFEDGLHPWMQLTLLQVQEAKRPLPAEAFAEDRFINSSVVFTNIFSNNALYSLRAGGKMIKIDAPGTGSPGAPPPARYRNLVLICLGTMNMAVGLLFWKVIKQKKQ